MQNLKNYKNRPFKQKNSISTVHLKQMHSKFVKITPIIFCFVKSNTEIKTVDFSLTLAYFRKFK